MVPWISSTSNTHLLFVAQVRELFVGAMQVDFDGVAEEQEGIEPDVRLPVGAHGDEVGPAPAG